MAAQNSTNAVLVFENTEFDIDILQPEMLVVSS